MHLFDGILIVPSNVRGSRGNRRVHDKAWTYSLGIWSRLTGNLILASYLKCRDEQQQAEQRLTLRQVSQHVCCTSLNTSHVQIPQVALPVLRSVIASCDCTRCSCSISTFAIASRRHGCILGNFTQMAFAPERSMGKLSYFYSAVSANAIEAGSILQQELAWKQLEACAHDFEIRLPASEVSFALPHWDSCLDSLGHES